MRARKDEDTKQIVCVRVCEREREREERSTARRGECVSAYHQNEVESLYQTFRQKASTYNCLILDLTISKKIEISFH